MKPDIEIAQESHMKPIIEIAKKLGVENSIQPYGNYKAKIDHQLLMQKENTEDGKMVLVTAINPTPAGEGKTTTTVGLSDALQQLGKNVVTCLREPSLGPVFGVKGGAAGGGYAQILPMEDINLHFTGDIHAITAANNLLAAMIDNHIYQGNELNIDPRRVTWRRALDMNDRQLRNILDGLGGKVNGTPREDGFDITVASEVMAVFCLSENIEDLKNKLSQMIIGYTYDNQPVTCGDLHAQGAMTALLKDAFNPNLVQSIEHTPCLVHGGPFANIAHGCNSVIATKLALKLGDIVVTEAGFGADLGAEKFLDIKCRKANITPAAVVLVATIRALKHHGGCKKEELNTNNVAALQKGMPNLLKHIENLQTVYGLTPIVAINQFPTDSSEEINWLLDTLKSQNIRHALSQVFEKGGEGGLALAQEVVTVLNGPKAQFQFSYDLSLPIEEKIKAIAQKIYGADNIAISPQAEKMIQTITEMGYGNLPVCIAKTQYSLSDNPTLLGAPTGFTCQIRQVKLSAGAGFIVCLMGDIMTMPGLPKKPAAENIDVTPTGLIKGLF